MRKTLTRQACAIYIDCGLSESDEDATRAIFYSVVFRLAGGDLNALQNIQQVCLALTAESVIMEMFEDKITSDNVVILDVVVWAFPGWISKVGLNNTCASRRATALSNS